MYLINKCIYCKINFILTATIKCSKNITFLCEDLFKMSFEKKLQIMDCNIRKLD